MKEKFEELFTQWEGYFNETKKFAQKEKEAKDKLLEGIGKLSKKEQQDIIFKVNSTAQKSNNDMTILSIRLKTIFDLIEDKSDIEDKVLEAMKSVTIPPSYYVFSAGKLVEINAELHQAVEENYKYSLAQLGEEEDNE